MTIKHLYPTTRPTLNLDFAKTKQLDPRITFSRASTGTYVDANGVIQSAATDTARFNHNPATGESLGLLVEEARTNTITYSSIGLADVNTQRYAGVAPDGTFTAALITNNNLATGYRNSPGAGTFTYSVFVKQGTSTTFRMFYAGYGGTDWTFTFSTETLVVAGAWTNARVEKYPNGWYRLSATSSARDLYYYHFAADLTTSTVFFWGAQVEADAFPTSYIPTPASFTSRASTATFYDSAGVIQTAGSGVARSNAFFPDSSGVMRSAGLLLEAAGTNLVTYSEQLNDASWTQASVTVTANSAAGPDGTTTADLVYPSTTGTLCYVYKSTTISSSITTMSFFVKASGFTRCYLVGGTTSLAAWFDLSAGTVGTVTSGCSASIQKLANGWFRCSLTQPATTTPYISIGPCDADNSFTATTSATNGILVWGAQLETGSYSTSYVPTAASTVTRSADTSTSATVTRSSEVVSLVGSNFSSWYNPSEGTLSVETPNGLVRLGGASNTSFLGISAGALGTALSTGDGIKYGSGSPSTNTRAFILASGTTVFDSNNAINAGKVAIAYKQDDFAIARSSTLGTDTSGNVPTGMDRFTLRTFGATPYKRITYWPTRLSNATLQAITAT